MSSVDRLGVAWRYIETEKHNLCRRRRDCDPAKFKLGRTGLVQQMRRTGLYFRVIVEGPYYDEIEIPLGLFDDPNGFQMTHEIYNDHKPDSFAFAGKGRKNLTRQQCVEQFNLLDSQ